MQRLAELEAEQKVIASKNVNPSVATYNKIKSLLAEK